MKRRKSSGALRPLATMAFVMVQIVLPFASPFAVGTQSTSAASSVTAADMVPKNIRASARVSVQMSTASAAPEKHSSIRKFMSTLNPLSRSLDDSWKGGENNSTLPSQLLFRYVSPLVDLASQRQLDADDAFTVSEERKMGSVVPKLARIYDMCRSKAQSQRHHNDATQSAILLKALLLDQRRTLIYTGILRLLNTAVQAFPALLVAKLLHLVESGGSPRKALGAALSLVAVLTLKMIIENQYFHKVVNGATEVRGSLAGLIFDKSLRLPGGGGGVRSPDEDKDGNKVSLGAGGVLNLMQSDASILEFAAMQLHTIWDGPLQVSLLVSNLLSPCPASSNMIVCLEYVIDCYVHNSIISMFGATRVVWYWSLVVDDSRE